MPIQYIFIHISAMEKCYYIHIIVQYGENLIYALIHCFT